MATVYLGLGTNLGDRLGHLRAALARLPDLRACSSVYETEPWGVTDQPHFLNLCCRLETGLAAPALHAQFKRIEHDLGRQPGGQRWGPRPIDIDLLTYDDVRLETAELNIPHPRIANRAFVLRPLAELAPGLRVPGLDGTVADLLAALPDASHQAWVFAPPPC
jgi:2-amino-4-hydroxy-6-hydroxymethyldihydropteridine diphosphokinase